MSNSGEKPDIPVFPPLPLQSGWVCPKCGSVLAPFMAYCVHCVDRKPVSPAHPLGPSRTGDPARTDGIPPYTGQPQIFCEG